MIDAIRNLKRDRIDVVPVTIAGGAATGTSTAKTDPSGTVIGIVPNCTNNPDAHVKKVSIAATTGLVTVTTGSNSTNEVVYNVIVLK